jgi:hypothetical protein
MMCRSAEKPAGLLWRESLARRPSVVVAEASVVDFGCDGSRTRRLRLGTVCAVNPPGNRAGGDCSDATCDSDVGSLGDERR